MKVSKRIYISFPVILMPLSLTVKGETGKGLDRKARQRISRRRIITVQCLFGLVALTFQPLAGAAVSVGHVSKRLYAEKPAA
ncbi:MAG TPA: hypothetical protein DCZ69_04700 [Syntrophobacteraceae bacterium]|nr:hypothetical protein [Syntrophobacteraceae bacterium]HBD07538.1 hypothetical protein [Syntrophobacteraceae bacterium]HBZ54572.1 hypothetical protein [Syntrophobacteraceae bacterium]